MSGIAPGDLAACRDLLRRGSKSFFAASLLLPRPVREPATALYAFCRVADDAVDRTDDPARALERLHARLDAIYGGRPADDPVDRALAAVAQGCALPRAPLDALLEGFAWDAENRRYADIAALTAYAVRVAGTVGVMMTALMGCRNAATLARACDLGVAMQLTNIARDVGEDARNGRLYLPLAWLDEEGVDAAAFMADPRFAAPLGRVVGRLLDHAAALYERSRDGVAALPPDCRMAIHAARLVYSEIGRMVRANGGDSVSVRAVVSGGRKVALLAEALVASRAGADGAPHRVLPEARFLVETVAAAPEAGRPAILLAPAGRTARVIDILAKLEHRRLARRAAAFGGLAEEAG